MKIQLYNRYRDKVYLEHLENDVYALIVDLPSGEDFTRYIYNTWPDDIEAVDPSGGPYISIGENTLSVVNDPDGNTAVSIQVDKIYVVNYDDKITQTQLRISSLKFFKE